MQKAGKIFLFLIFFTLGLLSGYLLTIKSLFPTCHGNFIFASAPFLDVHTKQKATSVHLGLVHDMSFWCEHTWYYQFWVTNAKGKLLYKTKLNPRQVGGRFNLESSGSLEWEEQNKAITARINDFVYRYELPQQYHPQKGRSSEGCKLSGNFGVGGRYLK